jgi:hypothetical protein
MARTPTQLHQATSSTATFPKLTTLKKDPIAKKIIQKLVRQQTDQRYRSHRASESPLSIQSAQQLSEATTQSGIDSEHIFQLLPDTTLAMQVLVSSILSPKDMLTVELDYLVKDNVLSGEMNGALLSVIEEHFTKTYPLKEKLTLILEQCLFKRGSYPIVVLPENQIDALINEHSTISSEALTDLIDSTGECVESIGLLGGASTQTPTWSFEAYATPPKRLTRSEMQLAYPNTQWQRVLPGKIIISDNPNILRLPRVMSTLTQAHVNNCYTQASVGFEARVSYRAKNQPKTDDESLKSALYPHRHYEKHPFIPLEAPESGQAPGHPLVLDLPSEAVIPVYTPSDPTQHVGYFILVDEQGYPVSKIKNQNYYQALSAALNQHESASQLLQAEYRASVGQGKHTPDQYTKEMVRVFSEVVEKELITRLKNGVYKQGVDINPPTEIYHIMLSRALAHMNTRLLYLPKALMSYIAFNHTEHGVGKTLLEDSKILASIRSMLLFSNTMAAIKNSTGKTSVKIELDPDDPDPSLTVDKLVHEYAKHRQGTYPLGASNPVDLIDFLQNAGIDIQVSGNTAYPETRMDVDQYTHNKAPIDRELDDEMKSRYFMALGLSPETIDLSKEVQFATSIVSSNLLLAKRVMLYQDQLITQLQQHIQRVVRYDERIWSELVEAYEQQRSTLDKDGKALSLEQGIDAFLTSLQLTLPKPDTAKLENQLNAFQLYTDALENAVDAYFGEDSFMLREFDDVEETIRSVRAAVIAHYQRQWLHNNNVLPELQALVMEDKNGKTCFDLAEIHGTHLEHIGESIAELIEKMRKDRKKRDKTLGEHENDESLSILRNNTTR